MKPTTEKRAMWNGNNFAKLFERGIAVGMSDIKTDTITFRFGHEQFTIPSVRIVKFLRWTGYYYEAPIKKVRLAAT